MLTGTPPYTQGDHMSVMYQHIQAKAKLCEELNPDIPPELAAIVKKSMEVDKLKRYSSMDDLRDALVRLALTCGTSAWATAAGLSGRRKMKVRTGASDMPRIDSFLKLGLASRGARTCISPSAYRRCCA